MSATASSTPAASDGRATRKPCTSTSPLVERKSSWVTRSTPSIVTRRPRLRHSATIELAMEAARGFESTSASTLRSSLTRLSGSCSIEVSEE